MKNFEMSIGAHGVALKLLCAYVCVHAYVRLPHMQLHWSFARCSSCDSDSEDDVTFRLPIAVINSPYMQFAASRTVPQGPARGPLMNQATMPTPLQPVVHSLNRCAHSVCLNNDCF